MEETIYMTPESWGNETYYFCESSMDEYIKGMTESFDTEVSPDEAEALEYNHHVEAYESAAFFSYGDCVRNYYRVTDWSDPSDLVVDFLGTFPHNADSLEE